MDVSPPPISHPSNAHNSISREHHQQHLVSDNNLTHSILSSCAQPHPFLNEKSISIALPFWNWIKNAAKGAKWNAAKLETWYQRGRSDPWHLIKKKQKKTNVNAARFACRLKTAWMTRNNRLDPWLPMTTRTHRAWWKKFLDWACQYCDREKWGMMWQIFLTVPAYYYHQDRLHTMIFPLCQCKHLSPGIALHHIHFANVTFASLFRLFIKTPCSTIIKTSLQSTYMFLFFFRSAY